jgi:hypothetical protein
VIGCGAFRMLAWPRGGRGFRRRRRKGAAAHDTRRSTHPSALRAASFVLSPDRSRTRQFTAENLPQQHGRSLLLSWQSAQQS